VNLKVVLEHPDRDGRQQQCRSACSVPVDRSRSEPVLTSSTSKTLRALGLCRLLLARIDTRKASVLSAGMLDGAVSATRHRSRTSARRKVWLASAARNCEASR